MSLQTQFYPLMVPAGEFYGPEKNIICSCGENRKTDEIDFMWLMNNEGQHKWYPFCQLRCIVCKVTGGNC